MTFIVRSRPWDKIAGHFSQANPYMHALVQKIAAAPFASVLFGATSLDELLVAPEERFEWDHDVLRVRYQDLQITFEFAELPEVKTRWKKTFPAEQAFDELERFIRAKKWVPVRSGE